MSKLDRQRRNLSTLRPSVVTHCRALRLISLLWSGHLDPNPDRFGPEIRRAPEPPLRMTQSSLLVSGALSHHPALQRFASYYSPHSQRPVSRPRRGGSTTWLGRGRQLPGRFPDTSKLPEEH